MYNMPKIIELTVEMEVQKVSCPGVWLCQDGRVSLTVFALGTTYQTCLLLPTFPLMFKDVFYFRKRFQESCALNNICCLLKEETIYCELVQWCEDCYSGECTILAQYLGAINDVLFPPNMCSNDGVDLLMRRSKDFPGILSPKIEIATKMRIDEVWDHPCNMKPLKISPCNCELSDPEASRQKQVCHSAQYHRNKCSKSTKKMSSMARSRSRSRSCGTKSSSSLMREPEPLVTCECPSYSPYPKAPSSPRRLSNHRQAEYSVYNVEMDKSAWTNASSNHFNCDNSECDDEIIRSNIDADKSEPRITPDEDRLQKVTVESRYIDTDKYSECTTAHTRKFVKTKITPCICEICKRYHELFHSERS